MDASSTQHAERNPNIRSEFINRRSYHVGAVKLQANGLPKGIAVAPGTRVFLNDEEIRLTAEAPEDPKDNPFLPPDRTDEETGEPVPPALDKLSEGRYVPSDRYLPGEGQPEETREPTAEEVAAARADAAAKVAAARQPNQPVEGATEAEQRQSADETGATPAPAAPAAAAGSREPGEEVSTPAAAAVEPPTKPGADAGNAPTAGTGYTPPTPTPTPQAGQGDRTRSQQRGGGANPEPAAE